MKKIVFLLTAILGLTTFGLSQNYLVFNIDNIHPHWFCYNDDSFDGVILFGEDDCDSHSWYVTLWDGNTDIVVIDEQGLDSIVIYNQHTYPMNFAEYSITYNGCNIVDFHTFIGLQNTYIYNPFTEPVVWKHENESIVLDAHIDASSYECVWSTGEIGETIEVTEQGTYSVNVFDDCGSETYSIEVRNIVEIYRATCDLATNKNQVTWHTTPEQSEYITAVKVYRNNELVGTVPYTDGVFTDNMGSENTQWQYHIVGVSVEGDDCPIPSYWKRTIHLDHVQGTQGDHILQWTPYEEESPTKSEVTAYRIFDVVDGVPTQVIDVGNFTNVYTYNPADFHGYGMVAAVFADEKGLEELAFSNLTRQMLEVGESSASTMIIYPNPTNGIFTVEGTGHLTVMNLLGQEILTREIEGKTALELSQGIYFVRLGATTKKVVVE